MQRHLSVCIWYMKYNVMKQSALSYSNTVTSENILTAILDQQLR